jgi:hypothetical protein
MWVLFMMVSLLKALVYSLNDPVVELLYMPTSETIKYKAKAWIDVAGARFAKAVGSLLTSLGRGDPTKLRHISEMPLLLISLVLIIVVWVTGKEFDSLVLNGIIVGDEDSKAGETIRSIPQKQDSIDRNGRYPGEVGYEGYDSELFDGVEFGSSKGEEEGLCTDPSLRRYQIQQKELYPPFEMDDFVAPGQDSKQAKTIWR